MNGDDRPELRSIWDEAKAHIERGDYDKAIEIYRYVLIRYAENDIAVEYANAYLGDIFLTIRGLELAEKHLKMAITIAPGNSHYYYLLCFAKRVITKAFLLLQIRNERPYLSSAYLGNISAETFTT